MDRQAKLKDIGVFAILKQLWPPRTPSCWRRSDGAPAGEHVTGFVSMERETIGNPEDDETTSPALVHLLPIDDNIRLHLNDVP